MSSNTSSKVLHHSDGTELIPSEIHGENHENIAPGYTEDDEGIINSYSLEPDISAATYPNTRQQLQYIFLGAGALVLVTILLFIVFKVS